MAGNISEFRETQTPKRACLRIPTGHVVVNSKWRNSIFTSGLQGVNITYEENLGHLDFQPASQIGIVYATEADLASQASLKRKLVKLRKANEIQVVVLAEKTASSSQYYPTLQKFVAMELGFQITPIPSQREAAGLVSQIVHSESEHDNNPFKKRRKSKNLDEALLSTVQSIPKLGGVKARKLLEHFNSLQAINEASNEELTSVVGKASANNIRQFLDTSIHPTWR